MELRKLYDTTFATPFWQSGCTHSGDLIFQAVDVVVSLSQPILKVIDFSLKLMNNIFCCIMPIFFELFASLRNKINNFIFLVDRLEKVFSL